MVERKSVTLDDRFTRRDGEILITGVQALVRLMLVQADRDAAAGLKTGGFVSGYRGSPLGTLDVAFAGAGTLTKGRGIVVTPAVNEELAATAVAGSQQIAQSPGARVQGVFALWYGKGPGLDRASDAIRHGVYQGASPHGGVVLAVGDDHVAKSSSIVCYSDTVVAGLQIPLFYPADAAEIVSYGLHAFALSRHTGSWAALKIITEVADATRTVSGADLLSAPDLPAISPPAIGLHNRWPESPLEQEMRHVEHRAPAVAAYVRANALDRIVFKAGGARVGLVAAGKSWLDLLEGLRLLGLDESRFEQLGVALYKPALIWPLEPEGLRDFAKGLETLVVIEEKGAFIEDQCKTVLYGSAAAPDVWGKRGPGNIPLLPAIGDLTPELIAARLGPLLGEETAAARSRADQALAYQAEFAAPMLRKPFFCSGCPHNRSTVVPEGSRAAAGIGCHGLAAYNRPRTGSFAQMGGEGIHWMGLAPFTDEAHLFANMGDGTYFHSGLLAIRQAVAAKLNITYKLLYNSAVAMTGGQSVDGELSVAQVVDQLRAEGVRSIVISTDDPDRYGRHDPVRALVERIEHRDDLDALQRDMRERSGVGVILYDQMCATEKRRLRKRGKLPDPTKRVFINHQVCEGCGDCSAKSNCLSVEPIDTSLGVKRRINQSSCNKDYSCLTGFCPSFVTVDGVTLKRARGAAEAFDASILPPPPARGLTHERIVVAGVGGTGVVTIGALAAMAAHMAGRSAGVLDQVGMAQKGGAVISHVHLADQPITALRIPPGQADLILICDQVVGNMRDVLAAVHPGMTRLVVNTDVSITGDFTQNREATPDVDLLTARISRRAGAEHVVAHPFTKLSNGLFGDTIASNLLMLGLAWQKGWLGLDLASIHAAIDLNGAAVAMNRSAFAWGRRLAVDSPAVYAAAGFVGDKGKLEDPIDHGAEFLADYQDRAYAARFRSRLDKVAAAERRAGGDGSLTKTAARALLKLMAYKDEYEVARLHAGAAFAAELSDAFDGKPKLTFHLAPPLFAPRDKITGEPRKLSLGGWMLPVFRLLARARRLRGTTFDVFGYTRERREERGMIVEYEALLERLSANLSGESLQEATEIAAMALEVRGFGHVKAAALAKYRDALARRLEAFGEAPTRSRVRVPALAFS